MKNEFGNSFSKYISKSNFLNKYEQYSLGNCVTPKLSSYQRLTFYLREILRKYSYQFENMRNKL